MVWQQGCAVVVCLTNMVEAGKNKCAQYYPAREGKTVKYGRLVVLNHKISSDECYTLSILQVKHTKTGEQRDIAHLYYLKWPDKGTPENSLDFIKLVRAARDAQLKYAAVVPSRKGQHMGGPPMVVHCSAGIGRSGTFVALDICLRLAG